MPGRGESIDRETRLRMAANLRRLFVERRFENPRALAERLGVNPATMYRYLGGEREVGFDVALLIHRRLGVSLDWFVDESPPEGFYKPLLFSYRRRDALPPASDSKPFPEASPPAQSGKRKVGGGKH